MKFWRSWCCCTFTSSCWAQGKSGDEFSRKNTWTVFAEESQTSSHILMGGSRQRKLIDLGFGYTRRVMRFWGTDLGYHGSATGALKAIRWPSTILQM